MGNPRDAEFTEFVVGRRRYLRRFAYLLCGDWHRAEDLVQTALTKIYVAWPRIRADVSVEAYARQVVVRCHLDEGRRPWRRERSSERLPEVRVPDDLPYEDSDVVRQAVRALPARQRAVVVLRHWCGLSVEETAADLGCSVGTVKSQNARAVDRLRSLLTEATSDASRTEPYR